MGDGHPEKPERKPQSPSFTDAAILRGAAPSGKCTSTNRFIKDKTKGERGENLPEPHVRLIGNTGAHFDPIKPVSLEDAQQLVTFMRELIKYVFEMPHELERRRSESE